AIKSVVDSWEKEYGFDFKYVGISAPGIPNNENTMINFMPGRLSGLELFNWENYLSKKVFVLNDANAAMMAESRAGIAKDIRFALLVTLGTGMGGSILIDKKIYTGIGQKGGHLGHFTIDANDEWKDVTGQPGSIEEAIGDCSIGRRTNGKFSSTEKLVQAYLNGNQEAENFWLQSVKYLAIALSGLANVLSPELIIIGGGIAKAGNNLLEPLQAFFREYEWRPGINGASIVFAQHGIYAGAIGAAIFAHETYNNGSY
ncbi:MAG: ROK family protein, partial [Saprospiraceae bacterium]